MHHGKAPAKSRPSSPPSARPLLPPSASGSSASPPLARKPYRRRTPPTYFRRRVRSSPRHQPRQRRASCRRRDLFAFNSPSRRMNGSIEKSNARKNCSGIRAPPDAWRVFEAAISALLDKIDPVRRVRRTRTAAPVPARRRIAPALRDAVWRRDGGRCVFRSSDGRMRGARAGLQVDHIVPWARGGASTDPGNLRLLCRAHNLLEARRVFGDAAIDAAVLRRREGQGRGLSSATTSG
jgi:HNH endonuclease